MDIGNHTAFHLDVVQAIDLKEDETLLTYYGRVIIKRKEALQEVSKILLVNAYFSKISFVDPLVAQGFAVISRLRNDADLKYLYKGVQKKGRGRPKKHDGKINMKELDEDKITKVG